MYPSGTQYEIRFGDQWCCATEVGAGLRAYSANGRAVLDGFEADEACRSARGQVLAPWPNRIAGGNYTWDGGEHRLPINEPDGSAIHGLVRWANWELWDHDVDRVALEHTLQPEPGYPFTLHLQVEYLLDTRGLTVKTIAENVGDRGCPFALGYHPYIAGAPTVDELRLHVPARKPADFAEPRMIGDAVLDTTYSDLEADEDGLVRVRVGEATVWMDRSFRYVQLYSGEGRPDVERRSLAVEPMTSPPNAFRTGEGLIRLEPGAKFVGHWGIEP